MLFRQMIVEYQQIAPVIDRRRTMLPNDPTTRFAACATVIGIHHTERRSCPGSPSRSSRQILRRKIPGQDHHVVRTRTIQAKSRIFRLVFPPRRNLQTTSALVDHKRRIAFFKLCIRQSPNRFGFAFTYRKRPVNEWRVHAVPPEMTGPGEPVGQPGNTAKAAA